jgi:hypothetical protein
VADLSELKLQPDLMVSRRYMDYHQAADFIEAVRQLQAEYGFALERGVQFSDEPNGLPSLTFTCVQIGKPSPVQPDSPVIREQIMGELQGNPRPDEPT